MSHHIKFDGYFPSSLNPHTCHTSLITFSVVLTSPKPPVNNEVLRSKLKVQLCTEFVAQMREITKPFRFQNTMSGRTGQQRTS